MVSNFRPLPLTGACPGQCPSSFFLIGPKDVFIHLPGRFDRLQAVALFFKSVILVLSSVFFSLCLFSFLLLSSVFFFFDRTSWSAGFPLVTRLLPRGGCHVEDSLSFSVTGFVLVSLFRSIPREWFDLLWCLLFCYYFFVLFFCMRGLSLSFPLVLLDVASSFCNLGCLRRGERREVEGASPLSLFCFTLPLLRSFQ